LREFPPPAARHKRKDFDPKGIQIERDAILFGFDSRAVIFQKIRFMRGQYSCVQLDGRILCSSATGT
jgi:hypothetical protein